MSEADGLRQAVLDAPEDDAPRLVYADWLTEHGMDDLATFIRTQCATPTDRAGWYGPQGARVLLPERCKTTRIGFSGVWWVTDNVDATWFREHAAAVIGGAKQRNEWTWLWRRGFVDELCLPADAAVLDLPELRKVYPVRKVTVVGEPGELALRALRERWPGPRRAGAWKKKLEMTNRGYNSKGVRFDFKDDLLTYLYGLGRYGLGRATIDMEELPPLRSLPLPIVHADFAFSTRDLATRGEQRTAQEIHNDLHRDYLQAMYETDRQ